MFKNYIKIAWRNLWRNRVYSLINITGLTIGLAACLLVATVVVDDLSYDRMWTRANSIYRVITVDKSNKNAIEKYPRSLAGLGPSMVKTFPEVQNYCRMSAYKSVFRLNENKDGVELHSLSAEPTVWNTLDFTVLEGNPKKFVKGYVNLVITSSVRKQYFADLNPIGKVITDIPSFGQPQKYLITGVIKDLPANTHLRANVMQIQESWPKDNILSPQGDGTLLAQYVIVKPGTPMGAFTAKVNHWFQYEVMRGNRVRSISYEFQPITDVYLKSTDFPGYSSAEGSMRNVYIFSVVAVLLLCIACINFVNLTTARALKRVHEAGIRKVLGAERSQLVAQFLFESLLFFFISFAAGMLLYAGFLKPLEIYLDHPLALTFAASKLLFFSACGMVLLISIITGIYPAFLVSIQNPVSTIKGEINTNVGSGGIRKALLVVQFTIAIVVLLATIIVQRQMRFINQKDLGFNKDDLLNIEVTAWGNHGKAFKQEVLKLSSVENASFSNWSPSEGGGSMTTEVDDPHQKGSKLKVWYINADIDFAATMGLHLQKGRWLNPKMGMDAINLDSLMQTDYNKMEEEAKKQSVLTTAYTVKALDITTLNQPLQKAEGVPVGVISDFNNESLHIAMKPAFIRAATEIEFGNMLIRVHPGTEKQALAGIGALWQRFYPEKILQFGWTDDLLKDQYKTEHKLQQLLTLFSFLILFLACMGLFGLTAFTVELRVKEIGIRRVLGASVTGIAALLSRDYIKLILLAILIASPVAWYAMHQWLQDFAYRIAIQWWVFAVAGITAVTIALLTTSFQSVKAALVNPVKSLRSE